MKVIIAGSRGINSPSCALAINRNRESCPCPACWQFRLDLVRFAMKWSNLFRAPIKAVISGCATGIDSAGELWAARNHLTIDLNHANWTRYKKRAGFVRNLEMLKKADWLVAVWNGKSKGTYHIIRNAKRRGIKVFVLEITQGGRKKWYGDGYAEDQRKASPVKGNDGIVTRSLLD